MSFNYDKLRGKIREKYKTEASFAAAVGLSRTTLSQKLNNQTDFGQDEICKISELLEISDKEIPIYFFAK